MSGKLSEVRILPHATKEILTDMEDIPRQKLIQIVSQNGHDIYRDSKRLEALLKDLCGEYKREVNLLIGALRERVPDDLLASSEGMPIDVVSARLAQRLHENLGFAEEFARWAVDAWGEALGQGRMVGNIPLSLLSRPGVQLATQSMPSSQTSTLLDSDLNCILEKVGASWCEQNVWPDIWQEVKIAADAAGLDERTARRRTKILWETMEIEKIAERREQAAISEHHSRQVQLVSDWLKSLTDWKWNYEQWDEFLDSLVSPVNIKILENIRDNNRFIFDTLTVQDRLTGSVWVRNWKYSSKPMIWDEANSLITKLNMLKYSDFSDWRLPARSELELLSKFNLNGPDINLNNIGFNLKHSEFWTSSIGSISSTNAWIVNLQNCSTRECLKTNEYYVLPVRG
jgi:hypothetical protein